MALCPTSSPCCVSPHPTLPCRGLGDTRTPFVGTLLANVLNIALEPLLIFKLGWGVAGAATAVGLSQVCVAGLSVLLLLLLHSCGPACYAPPLPEFSIACALCSNRLLFLPTCRRWPAWCCWQCCSGAARCAWWAELPCSKACSTCAPPACWRSGRWPSPPYFLLPPPWQRAPTLRMQRRTRLHSRWVG